MRRNSRDHHSQYRRKNIKSKDSPRKSVPNKMTAREIYSQQPAFRDDTSHLPENTIDAIGDEYSFEKNSSTIEQQLGGMPMNLTNLNFGGMKSSSSPTRKKKMHPYG